MSYPAKTIALFLDCIMSRRFLLGLKDRVERCGTREEDPDSAETGERDQYQQYEVVFAESGVRGGVAGKENGARWYETAKRDLGDRLGNTKTNNE